MTEIIQYTNQCMPALSIDQSIDRYNAVVDFVRRVMKKDIDFGTIPGTPKPTLLKPGAERLCMFFGLSIRFQLVEKTEDWSGKDHDGESFFYYMYRCQLYRGDVLIAESDASCNSFEKKYRYRNSERVCPQCGQPAILKSKKGEGWFCWAKKGGCGANFQVGDPSIEQQEVSRVPNPEIADMVNTIQKMSQKRALIGATLLAVNASEFFTQDVEDIYIDVPARPTNVDISTGEVIQHNEVRRKKMIDRIIDLHAQERLEIRRVVGQSQAPDHILIDPQSIEIDLRDAATEQELIDIGKAITTRLEQLRTMPDFEVEEPFMQEAA